MNQQEGSASQPSDSKISSNFVSIDNNFLYGFQPAFKHTVTDEVHLSKDSDGKPSLSYEFSGLPKNWITEWDSYGRPEALHPNVIAGYWHNARFVALTQLLESPLNA